jgi:hypothetical protein
MTVDPVMMNVFMAVITILILGIAGKIAWNWLMSGRIKTGEYYMTISACEDCREKCCVHPLKTALHAHVNKESGNDSTVNNRLANIEKTQQEAREDAAQLREDVKGIRSALDTMAGAFSVYVKKMDIREERDRRTNDLYGKVVG